jgi:threonine synthase
MTTVEPPDYSAENSKQPQQTQQTAITINIPTNFAEAFNSLAEREGLTQDELFMRSLGLYSLASQAEEGNYALSFTRIEGTNDLTVKEAIRVEDEPESRLILPR